jgi:hypothetical protein
MHPEYYIPLKLSPEPRNVNFKWPHDRKKIMENLWETIWTDSVKPEVIEILKSRKINAWRSTIFYTEGIAPYSPHIDCVRPGQLGCWGLHWHWGSSCVLKWYHSDEDKKDHHTVRSAWDAKEIIYETVVQSPCLIRINRAHSVHNLEDRERWALRLTGTPDSWNEIKSRLEDLFDL